MHLASSVPKAYGPVMFKLLRVTVAGALLVWSLGVLGQLSLGGRPLASYLGDISRTRESKRLQEAVAAEGRSALGHGVGWLQRHISAVLDSESQAQPNPS